MTFIFTGLFSNRFRLTIHYRFTEGPVANSCLSRTYNVQVKNAVVLEEMNRLLSMESVSARRCNFGHSSTLYNAFLAYF